MKRLKHTFITFDMNKIVHHSKKKKKIEKKRYEKNSRRNRFSYETKLV